MSYYYLSTLHKSYCLKDAFVLNAGLSEKSGELTNCLAVCMDGLIELWDISGQNYRRICKETINFAPKHFIHVSNYKGKEDGIIMIDSESVVLLTFTGGKAKTRSIMKLAGKKNVPSYDYLLIPEKTQSNGYHLVVGDKTAHLTIIKISYEEGNLQLVSSFTVYLDSFEFELFEVTSLVKESSNNYSIGVLSGNQETASHISIIELDLEKKFITNQTDLRELCLKTKEGSEVFQERIYKIYDLGNKCIAVFCSHSIKLFKVKDNSFQKITSDRVKLPQSDSVLVELYPNKKNSNFIFIMANFVTSSKTTFIYLIEIPSGLATDKMSITFLGNCSSLRKPPIIIGEKRLLLMSEVECGEIVEITQAKTSNPQRPFLKELFNFENFGIIQQIETEKQKKSIVINSFKSKASLQTFQKGLLIEQLCQFGLDVSKMVRILLFDDPNPNIALVYPSKTVFYHFGDNFQIHANKSIIFEESLISFKHIFEKTYFAVCSKYVRVYELWEDKKALFTEDFLSSDEEITSADSFQSTVVYTSQMTLFIKAYFENKLNLVKRVELEAEPSKVQIQYRKVFILYWLKNYVDCYGINGANHWRIQVGHVGIHSINFFYGKEEQSVLLLGTKSGSVIHKLFNKNEIEMVSSLVQIGKRPVELTEIKIGQHVAISDEPAMLCFSKDFSTLDLLPLCNTELIDLRTFLYNGVQYYFMIGENYLGFSEVKAVSMDNYRLKTIGLEEGIPIDKFIIIHDRMLTCHNDTDSNSSQIAVHRMPGGKTESALAFANCQVESMHHLTLQNNSYIFVGLSQMDSMEKDILMQSENLSGRLRVYLLKEDQLIEIQDSQFEKPVRGIYSLDSDQHLLLNVGYSTLKVFKIESKLRKVAEKTLEVTVPHLKEILQQKFHFLIDNLSVMDNQILMSDYFWMVHVIIFENTRYPRFKPVGKISSVYNEIIGAELLSGNKFIVSDKADNLLIYSLADVGNCDNDFIEFTEKNFISLGEKVISFDKGERQASLKFQDSFFEDFGEKGSVKYILMGGSSGGIYVLYEIPRKVYILMEDLQRCILASKESDILTLKRRDYRRVTLKNRKTKFATGIIDGDVLSCLIRMPDSDSVEVIKRMSHVNKPSLSDIRNLLRYFDNNPVT